MLVSKNHTFLQKAVNLKHLVINSFPQSGNMFLSTVVGRAFSLDSGISAVHLPEIFQVEDIYNVSVFRNPSDAIASLLSMGRKHTGIIDEDSHIDYYNLDYELGRSIKSYIKYLDAAEAHFGNIHIVSFDDLLKDYRTVIEQISLRYPLPIQDGYEKELSFDTSRSLWSDITNEHIPDQKDLIELEIEKRVSPVGDMAELTNRYSALIDRARRKEF